MEGDEMEMTEKELRMRIRRMVRKNKLIVALVEKCNLLRSLLRRRENEAVNLLRLRRSVAACEELVKRHYSLLGWEYQDICSDDETSSTVSESVSTHETSDHGFSSPNDPTSSLQKPADGPNLCGVKEKTFHIDPNRLPVVVLTPLSPSVISFWCLPAPKSPHRENEDSLNFDSESSWEPESDKDSNSDFSITSEDACPKKRQKIDGNGTNQEESSTHCALTNSLAESKMPANNDASDPPSIPDAEICINMTVLARNHIQIWQKGKIIEIVKNDFDALMYKVCFEDEEKHLVIGHDIAFGDSAQLDQLSIGSSVVVECADRVPRFHSGILAELPTPKNKHRLLVFFDHHIPVYVTISSIHCVCKPLKNPLDDIVDKMHKIFMRDYLDEWPYPPRVQYCVGQKILAMLDDHLQSCEVVKTDSSLIQVVFEVNQQKDWIYRGSPRLEHILRNRMTSKVKSHKLV